tara:strand:+ start:73 stop:666 length:594 start_codon:yes stop_codon:yes gene_type:complete
MIKLNKGAMFGLDARIALAIFGALSVISGAALYSAIQESKVTAAIAEINEVKKAIEQYILDTGSEPRFHSSAHYKIIDLIKKPANVDGWNGPYLSYEEDTGSDLRIKAGSSLNNLYVYLRYASEADWDPAIWQPSCVSANKPCAMWIEIEGLDRELPSIGLQMDKIFDNDDGYGKGKVRAKTDTSIMYKFKRSFTQP